MKDRLDKIKNNMKRINDYLDEKCLWCEICEEYYHKVLNEKHIECKIKK